jgi:hypothetical protein
VRVHVGPLPPDGVLEWIDFARGVLDRGVDGVRPFAESLPEEVLEGFRGFLDEWEEAARTSDPFLWETEVDPEQAEFLAHSLLNIARELEDLAARRGQYVMPPSGVPFYRAFIEAFLHAMTLENKSLAAYAEDLRASWPGVELE